LVIPYVDKVLRLLAPIMSLAQPRSLNNSPPARPAVRPSAPTSPTAFLSTTYHLTDTRRNLLGVSFGFFGLCCVAGFARFHDQVGSETHRPTGPTSPTGPTRLGQVRHPTYVGIGSCCAPQLALLSRAATGHASAGSAGEGCSPSCFTLQSGMGCRDLSVVLNEEFAPAPRHPGNSRGSLAPDRHRRRSEYNPWGRGFERTIC
jgi:hypothetical protein